jgi:hypothetical protein
MIQDKLNVISRRARNAAAANNDILILLKIPAGLVLLDTNPYPVCSIRSFLPLSLVFIDKAL